MTNERNYIKVKWLKAHWDYAYSKGDVGFVSMKRSGSLLKDGFILPLPEDDEDAVNPLADDMPARDVLFDAGFESIEKIKEAGDSLIDVKGIGKGMLKQIKEYLEKQDKSNDTEV